MTDTKVRELVLIIDDEESVRDGCIQALERSGYAVIATGDGTGGIALAREKRPALAFIDLKMPDMAGMEIIDVLLKDIPDIVPIVITGYASIVSAVESMKRGAYDYLPKPFTPDQLRAATKRGLQHRELKIEARKLRDEKEQIQKNFITFVSHEMRSPLVTIQQYIESLKVVSAGALGEEAMYIIDRCVKRVKNLEELVEHWLDVSRIESGTFAREKAPVSVKDVLVKSIEEMALLSERRGIHVEVDVPDGLPEVKGDRESLIRVFINIIGNATKYTFEGGTISVRAGHADHYLEVTIADNGRGIPEDKVPFIFEPFYRVKGKGEPIKGSGLGLTFCRLIMEAHGGSIGVTSKVGKGTTFTLKFPV